MVEGVAAADVAATRKSAVDFEESDRVAVRRSGLRSNVRNAGPEETASKSRAPNTSGYVLA